MFSWADGDPAGGVYVCQGIWHLATSKNDIKLKDAKEHAAWKPVGSVRGSVLSFLMF